MAGLTKTGLETTSTLKPSWENWVVVLDLSTQFHLPEVRAFAIRQLSSALTGRALERAKIPSEVLVAGGTRRPDPTARGAS